MNENINSKYYLLVADSNYPALKYRNPDFDLGRRLSLYKPITLPEEYDPLELHLRDKISKPKIVDYHILYGIEHVVSARLKQAIEEMRSVNIGFLPAIIHANSDEYDGYFILNCYHVIPAMDKEKSFWRKSSNPRPDREVLSIDKLVIDMDKLKDIPLSERLIFSLGECRPYTLFHESVIDTIEKLNPKGLYAVAVEAWDSNLMMDL